MNWGLRVLVMLSSVCWVIAAPSPMLAQSSCNSFAVFAVGDGYNVQNNGFNLQGATQCVTVNSNGTNWSVTTNANVPTNGAPSGYPSIYAGCHWGACSPNQHGMPIQYTSITSSPTTWNVTPSPNGNWDIAYDIWFNPNSSTSNNSTGLELMVWINHMGSIQPAGSVVASNVTIGGMTWNIWRSGSTQNSGTVSYVATSPTNSFNFDLLNIYRDLVNRGYMSSNQWLIDIEAGTEVWTAGSNFATNSFSACVNCGGAPPAAPTNLTATAASSSQINLSWTGSSGATSYNVLRSTTNGGPYSQVASGVTSTSFSDTGLAAGTTYFYVVQACNSSGCSGNSNQASATTPSNSPPPAPTNLTAAGQDSQVSLTWTASSGATSYNVLRSTTNGGPYSQIASGVTTTSYLDTGLTNGTTYYYVVRAVNGAGTSGNSNQASATPTTAISFVRAAQHYNASGGSSIGATLANNAGHSLVVACRQGADATSISGVTDSAGNAYILVNKSSSGGAGTRETAVYAATNIPASSGNTVSCNFASNLSAAEGIVVLEFANVASVDASVTSSSGSTSVTSLSSGALTTTKNGDALIYAVTTSGDETTWTPATGYTIPANATNARQAVEYAIAGAAGSKSTSLSWGVSAVANGVFLALAPSSSGSPPAAPTNLSAAPVSSSQIDLSWTGSSGATSYNALRSTTNGGPYTQVANGVGSTSFSDTGLVASTTYFYVVQACNNNGCSGNSNQASATTQASSSNCHGGTQCLKGTLPSSQNYSNTSQVANASSNQIYVASIWIKGSGSVQLYVKNGNWGSTTLATVQCTASSSYTQCSTPSFSVGSNTQLTFILQNSFAGSGTVYLDDAFLGISGGSNVLSNPGFESGSTGWSISNTSTWTIGHF